MDAEERALLAAIIAHPDEDTPRLVYADWLQEHDQPERAEHIRLSIQLDLVDLEPEALNLLGNGLSEQVCQALRKRHGSRVWLEPSDRNGFPRRF